MIRTQISLTEASTRRPSAKRGDSDCRWPNCSVDPCARCSPRREQAVDAVRGMVETSDRSRASGSTRSSMVKKADVYADTSRSSRSSTGPTPPRAVPPSLRGAAGHPDHGARRRGGSRLFLRRYDATGRCSSSRSSRPEALEIAPVGAAEQNGGTKILRKYSDQDLTLVDAVGLHLMRARRSLAAGPPTSTSDSVARLSSTIRADPSGAARDPREFQRMPELPEVETTVRLIRPRLVGAP